MRQSESVFRMKFQEQNLTETEDTCRVDTICWDERGTGPSIICSGRRVAELSKYMRNSRTTAPLR